MKRRTFSISQLLAAGGPSILTICANAQPRVRLRSSLQEQPGNIHQDADRRYVPHERTS